MPAFDFVLSGRYRLLGPLGEGGMASVYRARDLRLNREVAVKILRADLTQDPEFLNRFAREAQLVASLAHPNIVPVYDVGEEGDTHFIVMEYIRGRSLKELLEAGPLDAARSSAIMQDVLGALGYAHEQGLVHRDVKPQNILLTQDGVARLTDFGIAHVADGSATRTAAILGSAEYLSPEQARGDEATPVSDIYAAGVVLYEMLTGKPPFTGQNALAIAHQHLYSEPDPLPFNVPYALSAATLRALAKDPASRYPDAAAFQRDVTVENDVDVTAYAPVVRQDLDESAQETRNSIQELPGDGISLGRSSRRTIALGMALSIIAAAVGYVAYLAPGGYALPHYPSPPYALAIVAIGVVITVNWLGNRSWSYRVDANAAVVQWGLFGYHRFGIPVRYITTIELKQSPLDRLLGLGTIELCARDQLGSEHRLVMEDLAHPRDVYEEFMHVLGGPERRLT